MLSDSDCEISQYIILFCMLQYRLLSSISRKSEIIRMKILWLSSLLVSYSRCLKTTACNTLTTVVCICYIIITKSFVTISLTVNIQFFLRFCSLNLLFFSFEYVRMMKLFFPYMWYMAFHFSCKFCCLYSWCQGNLINCLIFRSYQ